jgi:hypothetical protein
MENLDVQNIIPMLSQIGINVEQLSLERLEELMKLSDSIQNPCDITPEMSKKILDAIGIETKASVEKKSEKIKPNSICTSCKSGKKYKKCCGKNSN